MRSDARDSRCPFNVVTKVIGGDETVDGCSQEIDVGYDAFVHRALRFVGGLWLIPWYKTPARAKQRCRKQYREPPTSAQ